MLKEKRSNSMKNIIEAMFYGEINEAERKTKVERSKELDVAFDAFEKTLDKKQIELFDKYYLEDGLYMGEIERERYEQGFKTGFWLAVQLSNFTL